MAISNANLNASATVGYLVTLPFVDTDAYTISFPYLSATDFEVEVNNVILDAADYTIDTNAALLRLTAAAVARLNTELVLLTEAPVVIRRKTPILTRSVNYIDSSTLTAADLDLQANQLFYALQEARDKADLGSVGSNPVTNTLDFGGLELTSVGEPLSETSVATLGTVLTHLGIATYTQNESYYLGNLVISSGSVYRANKTVKPAPAVLNTADFDLMFTPSQIISNTASIATNAADIATNAADIATNAADIATNATGISTNLTNNTNNASAITGLSSSKLDAAGGTVSGDLIVSGNLTVNGTSATVNAATMNVTDPNIVVNNSGNQAAADLAKAGVTVAMTDAPDGVIGYDSTLASKFKAGETGAESEIITADAVQTMKDKTVEASSNTSKALVVKGALGQTEDLLDVQDSTGASKLSVGSDGTLSVKGGANGNDKTIVRVDAPDHFISMNGTTGNRNFSFSSDSAYMEFNKYGTTYYTGNSATRHNGTGLVYSPSYSWRADTNTGLYNPAADNIGFTCGGVERARLNSSNFDLTGAVFRPAQFSSASIPAASATNDGGIVYDTTLKSLKYSDGLSWSPIGSGTGSGGGKQSMYYTETFDAFSGAEFSSLNGGVIGAGSVVTNIAGIDTTTQLDGAKSATFTIPTGGAGTYALLVSSKQIGVPLYAQTKRQLMTFESRNTGNTGDFSVFIWDSTAGATIKDSTGSTLFIDPANGTQTNKLYFETNGTANLQWGVMINNSNAGAVLTIDNMSIDGSPDTKVSVHAGSDWKAFTPTGTWTGTYTGMYRRVGDSMEIKAYFTASGPQTGDLFINMPSGFSIDVSKELGRDVGTANFVKSSIREYVGSARIFGSTNRFSFFHTETSGSGNINSISPFTWDTGDGLSMRVVVPILGWSDKEDNVVVSGTKATYAYVECAGNAGQAVTGGTTDIPFLVTDDAKGLWNGTQFTADRDMIVEVNGQVATTSVFGGTVSYAVGGIVRKIIGSFQNSGNECKFSGLVRLNAGDVLSIRATGNHTLVNYAQYHHLTIKELPNYEDLILAYLDDSRVSGDYLLGTNSFSIPQSTETSLTGFTKVSNAVDGIYYDSATGVCTTLISGRYQFNISIYCGPVTGIIAHFVGIVKNGKYFETSLSGNTGGELWSSGIIELDLAAGETFTPFIWRNASAATVTTVNNRDRNRFSYHRIR